jgi:ABC-type transporter Mla maintaining outer membrane lipid asymmetry ATPase subunit MlaF
MTNDSFTGAGQVPARDGLRVALCEVTKRFGDRLVLDRVSLEVQPG